MAKVHLLDDELINKIAAGEVVEKPASVVKELVENAIDAAAQTIRVSLKDGGRQLIEVSDDGLGMSPEDAVMAIRRHTTSKLQNADDLFHVTTMGFRGEALASISSVSRFSLQTRARGASEGIRIQVEDGQLQSAPWQGSFGTTMTIRDLFYNVPARKSFLKTGAAEFASCYEYLLALALSLPQIGFRLVHNDREIFSVSPLPVNDGWPRGEEALRLRMSALFGEDFVDPLVYLQHQDRYLRLEALVSPPGQEKGSAKHVHTFVNNRWVRDKLLRYGVLRGYHSHLLKGKFPVVLMHCDVEASLVDVNVHPAKAELRFQYSSEVQNAIAMAIRDVLRKGAWSAAPTRTPFEPLPKTVEPAPQDFDFLLSETHASAKAKESEASEPSREAAPEPLGRTPSYYTEPADVKTPPLKRRVMSFDGEGRALEFASDGTSRSSESTPARKSSEPVSPTASESFSARSSVSRPPRESGPSESFASRSALSSESSRESSAPRESFVSRPSAASPAFSARTSDEGRSSTPSASSQSQRSEAPSVAPASVAPAAASAKSEEQIPWEELQFIGAFQRCFLFFEHDGKLLAVDQHAFHERVLYERLLKDPDQLRRAQPLLMPDVLQFSPSECHTLKQNEAAMREQGFDYTVISDTEVELRSVPALLMKRDLQAVFQSILNGSSSQQELLHDVLATVACHAAVRAGEDLPPAELKQLLDEAKTVDFFHNCPHGRRVFRWWKGSQVAAWFDRLG